MASQGMSRFEVLHCAARGLLSLPSDILALIIGYLTFHNVKALSLVNHTVHQTARYRILRDITVNLKVSDFDSTRLWLRTLERGKWLPAVRTLTILDLEYDYTRRRHRDGHDGPVDKAETARRIAVVCRAMRAMPGLTLLDWQGNNIPNAILERIGLSPPVKLSAHVHEHRQRQLRAIGASTNCLLHRLKHVRNLHTFDVDIRYSRANRCAAFMQILKSVLLASSTLRKLRLNVHMSTGCCIRRTPEEYHGLGFAGSERLPALEELELVAYPFSPGTDERAFWAERFDWSRLTRLSVCDVLLADLLSPWLTSLQELTYYDGERYRDFLLSVPSCVRPFSLLDVPASLQSVSFRFDQRLTVESVLQHSSTLTKLSMHGPESYRQRWYEGCFNIEQLRELISTCLVLEELELDLCRDGTAWPYAALDVLASCPRLLKLELWFPLRRKVNVIGVEVEQPCMTFSAATTFFTYLRDRGSRINELIVHSGAPGPTELGEAAPEADYPAQNSSTFRCALGEREREAAQGAFATTCLEVGNDANAWMRANAGQDSLSNTGETVDFDAFCERLLSTPLDRTAERCMRVAWLGPMAGKEWWQYAGLRRG